MMEWIIIIAIAFTVLLYIISRRVTGLSKKQAAWTAPFLGAAFIPASMYLGVRFTFILFALATAGGLAPQVVARWLPDHGMVRRRTAILIITGALLIIIGIIDWMVSGDRRRAYGVLTTVGAIIALLPWLSRVDET